MLLNNSFLKPQKFFSIRKSLSKKMCENKFRDVLFALKFCLTSKKGYSEDLQNTQRLWTPKIMQITVIASFFLGYNSKIFFVQKLFFAVKANPLGIEYAVNFE